MAGISVASELSRTVVAKSTNLCHVVAVPELQQNRATKLRVGVLYSSVEVDQFPSIGFHIQAGLTILSCPDLPLLRRLLALTLDEVACGV